MNSNLHYVQNMWLYGIIAVTFAIALSSAHETSADKLGLTVRTTSGTFTGFVNATSPNVRQWLGIPFGEPPIQDRRFLPPIPAKYRGEADATTYKPICIQDSTLNQGVFWLLVPQFQNTDPQSEDCLYLNLWAPRTPVSTNLKPAEKVPVIIWGMSRNPLDLKLQPKLQD